MRKLVLTLMLVLLLITASAVNAEEDSLADFNNGATALIDKCLPGLVLIYMGGGGSGFIVDREGYIFTNYHVAGSNHVVEVRTYDGEAYRAVNVGGDNSIDFALLKIIDPPDNLVPMALADSNTIKPGDICMSMGSPGGSSGSVDREDIVTGWLDNNTCNLGVVNAVYDMQECLRYGSGGGELQFGIGYGMHLTGMFNIDAEINAGNSGGPTVNGQGEVIGINTYGGNTGSRYFESWNSCVPINHHKKAARNIINYGHPRWPYLGVDILPRSFSSKIGTNEVSGEIVNPFITPELEDEKEGHIVSYVSDDSPAYDAGLRPGDVILTFNHKYYKNPFDICKEILMDSEVGDEVVLSIRRGDRLFPDVRITLREKYVRNDIGENYMGYSFTRRTF